MTERDERSSTTAIRELYRELILAWNRRDAAGMAALFVENGNMVGFDGSQVDGRVEIEAHLGPIFADHPTAAYVSLVRDARLLAPTVGLLRAVAGMVPPGTHEVKAALNTVHTLVAESRPDGWRAALFQSTPAAWHGRPADAAALTDELQDAMRRGVTVQ